MKKVKTNNDERKKKNENNWTDECEALLAEWSEKASCYRWLHGRCEKRYRAWYYCFSIPVIILSTLTGAANVGMDSFVPAESKSLASAIVGGVNIFAGIISTLQNFLKVAELMEGHRIAGVSWGKLQRNISIELALDPSRRVLQMDFLKLARAEYDRLIEAGPIIDDGVIKQFNTKFSNYEVSVPSICNGLDKCIIYKLDKSVVMDKEEFKDGIDDLIDDSDDDELNNINLNIVRVDKGGSVFDSEKEILKLDHEVKDTFLRSKVEDKVEEVKDEEVKDEEVKDEEVKDEEVKDEDKVEEKVEGKDEEKDEEKVECKCKEKEDDFKEVDELETEENKNINEFLDSIES